MPRLLHRRPVRPAALAAGLAIAIGTATLAQSGPKFYEDDPLWVEPLTQNASNVTRYEPNFLYEMVEGSFAGLHDPVLGQRARNLNTVDEVPDGPFFTNRAGRTPLTPELVARASNVSAPPAAGVWTVVSAKSDGVTPGFTVRDANGTLWFIKFDPPDWERMATGSEIVSAKLFWAVGYHTAEYHIERLTADRLQVAPEATIEPFGEIEREMRQSDIAMLLKRAAKDGEGGYRVIASRAVPGRPVGRIRFQGTRADDPNDIVPHEHRRELRAYEVFAAWLQHVDNKGINSMVSAITENGRTFLRGYLLDFGSTLGSAALKPRERWEGYEGSFEPPREIGKRIIAFGFRIPEWRRLEFYEAPSIGRIPANHEEWDPRTWKGHITHAAFRHARDDDRFWAAQKLSFINDAMIDAAVAEGRFGDPTSERALATMIKARRDRILQTYLPSVNPIVDPAVTPQGLTFTNAAVAAKVAPAPAGYTAEWATLDNASRVATVFETTRGTATPLPLPKAIPEKAMYLRVRVSAENPPRPEWTEPVWIYFRRIDNGWRLVGFERLP